MVESGDQQSRHHEVDWRCSIRCADWRYAERVASSYARNGVLLLQTRRALAAGAKVEITFHLPDVEDLVVYGVVKEADPKLQGVIVKLESQHEIDMMLLEEMAVAGGVESTVGAQPADIAEPGPTLAVRASTLPAAARRRTQIPLGPMARAIGIDFGTSNTSLAVAIGDRIILVPDALGRTSHPSLVHFPAKGEPIVGWDARPLSISNPRRTIASAKRLLGRRYDDPAIAGWLQSTLYQTSRGPDGSIVIGLDGDSYAVGQVCAAVLAHVRTMAESQLGTSLDRAVLTVPVGFTQEQRTALSRAGQIAGLEVIALVEEPVAAALAYGLGKGKNEVVAAYDFGGGTFDFTLLDLSGERFRVLATGGDSWLGGDDFDLALANAAADALWQWTTVDIRKRTVEWQGLIAACEQAKRKLSSVDSAQLRLDGIVEAHGFRYDIDRTQLEARCSALLDRSLDICRQTLAQAGLEPREITQVVASGGIAHIPFVRAGVARFFEREIKTVVDPQAAICVGAGLFAARLEDHPLQPPA
jgi:molecular chaperone DnaK